MIGNSVEALMLPQAGDSHPSSGLSRGILRIVLLEIDKIAQIYDLPLCDDVDEDRYFRAIAPYLRAVKAAWREDNQRPLGAEFGKIRAGIRDLGRWRRMPSEEEVAEIVFAALGMNETGAEAEARRVIAAPRLPQLPSVPANKKQLPPWLLEFASAVGDNELAQKTFIVPLLNMSDEAARRAIGKTAEGRDKARDSAHGTSAERMAQAGKRLRQQERRTFVDDCLRSVRGIVRESVPETESGRLRLGLMGLLLRRWRESACPLSCLQSHPRYCRGGLLFLVASRALLSSRCLARPGDVQV